MMNRKILLITFLSLLSFDSFAKDKTKDKDCSQAGSNNDMKQCWYAAFDKANEELTTIYKNCMSKFDNSSDDDRTKIISDRMKASEEAWEKFREANCSYISAIMLECSGEALIESQCQVRMTRERIVELKELIKEIGCS
jgi:uncharacterized protein YecT (DUF1311 family)